jgi:hypothetical protein
MVNVLAIAAAGAWLLVFGWCVVVTGRPALRAGTADPGLGLAPERPALVNLAVTRCRLNGAAYPATILGLAAKGFLGITQRGSEQLWCDVPASPSSEAALARSERLVLAGATALAGMGGAPFEALAQSCASDVRGRWDPFERAVRAEGRQSGITRPRLSPAVRAGLYAGAGGVCVLAYAAVHSHPQSGPWAPVVTALFAFAVPAYWAHALGRQDRLTAHGSALGAWAARAASDLAAAGEPSPRPISSPAELGRLAWAVAAGAPVQIPGTVPGLVTGGRPGRARAGARTGLSGQFAEAPRPSAAWSSFGGQWRMVRIGPTPFSRMHPAFWLVLAAWLGLMAYVSSLLAGPAGALAAGVLAAVAAAAVIGGTRGLAAWLGRPAETSFQAQVIARWVENRGANDDDSYITCIAVDDGARSWSFDVSGAAFGQLTLGDAVSVRASPRSGKLLGMMPLPGRTADRAAPARPGMDPEPGRASRDTADDGPPGDVAASDPAAGTPAAGGEADVVMPGALLAAGEVSAAIGRPVRATAPMSPAAGALYRGEGVTVTVTVADGFLGSLTSLARRRGQPLPGVGEQAWLLNSGRTAVLRAAGLTAKVTIGGSAARSLPPDALPGLAAAVAGRLAQRAAPFGQPSFHGFGDRKPGQNNDDRD